MNIRSKSLRLPQRTTQGGFALFIGLAVLLLLSLIGITSMQSTTMQEKMAGNYKVQHEAFQSTETQVVTGEIVLQNVITAADVNALVIDKSKATNAVMLANAPSTALAWTTLMSSVPSSSAVQEGKVNLNVSLKTNNSNNVYFYYVSAAGVAANPGGSAVVQTTYVH